MTVELIVACRRPVPPASRATPAGQRRSRTRPWSFQFALETLGDDDDDDDDDVLEEGALELHEIPASDSAFHAHVAGIVGFVPTAVLVIRPAAWEMSNIAAEVVARALHGAIYADCDTADIVTGDDLGGIDETPPGTRGELEARIRAASENPRPFFERWRRRGRDASALAWQRDPELRSLNDWSDV